MLRGSSAWLSLNLDERPIGRVESSRKGRGNATAIATIPIGLTGVSTALIAREESSAPH